MTTHAQPEFGTVITESLFVRNRKVLFTRADCSALFADWEGHIERYQPDFPEALKPLFRDALAAFTLHVAAKPRNQSIAWTLNFQAPLCNLFIGGDSRDDFVTGRCFTENIALADFNSFHQELVPLGKEPFRSFVPFEGNDPLRAAETFYEKSEQRPARFFRLGEERYAILSAHPDWDEVWFNAITQAELCDLDTIEVIKKLETRRMRWACDCSQLRILKLLLPVFREQPDFFGDEASLQIQCPRCAQMHIITREALEAFSANPK
jgi:molecular chaperone Hsp33